MTDQQNTAATEDDTSPQFSLQRIYVRDLSFEAPKSPAIFRQQWEPTVALDLNTRQKPLEDDFHEVVLTLSVTVKNADEVAFIAEVQQAGIFLIMAVFCAVFACLALGAAHAALFAPRGAAGAGFNANALTRADLVDRAPGVGLDVDASTVAVERADLLGHDTLGCLLGRGFRRCLLRSCTTLVVGQLASGTSRLLLGCHLWFPSLVEGI